VTTDVPAGGPRGAAPVTSRRAARPRPRPWRRIGLEVVAVLAAFAALGALGGYLWTRLWDLPTGVVQGGEWLYRDFPSYERIFSATAVYVVVGVLGGVLLGVVAAFVCRSPELVVLAAVAAGSALAAYVAFRVGVARSPVNPQLLALVVDDGTELRGRLDMPGRSPYVAWPVGALLGLGVTYLMRGAVDAGVEGARPFDDDPRRSTHHPG
jgi:hypothetical protein